VFAYNQLKKKRDTPSILIDASDIDKPSGGRTAVLELFKEVFRLESDWRFIILLSRREPDFDGFHQVRQMIIPFRHRILERIYIQTVISFLSLSRKADLVHFARTIGGVAWPARSVLTIFDLTTLRYPELHTPSAVWFWRYIQPKLLHWADRIISISNYVARDLNRYYHIPLEKIEVILCAPKSIFTCPEQQASRQFVKKKYSLPDRYLLFLGMIAKKKNLGTLIEALKLLKDQGFEFPPLVLAGRNYPQSDDENLFKRIKKLGLDSDIRYIGPVLDDELPALYKAAEMFIFPSIDEGFGIPCLEAMACGIPVVAARSGALPEIVGDAALLYEKHDDIKRLSEAILQLLQAKPQRLELIARGMVRIKSFSWSVQARNLLNSYRNILNSGNLD
jgi:glycosyltransferase involved in cell wall biosynthesis